MQADPIRAPARAGPDAAPSGRGVPAGDLERQYPSLEIEEDFFVNYGFVTRRPTADAPARRRPGAVVARIGRRVNAILEFVRGRGAVHPREVDTHFAHGRVTNYWGGSSNATTHLILMHYRGLLRVVRRDAGVRIYGVQEISEPTPGKADRARRLDALVDVVVGTAPLPAPSLATARVAASIRGAAMVRT